MACQLRRLAHGCRKHRVLASCFAETRLARNCGRQSGWRCAELSHPPKICSLWSVMSARALVQTDVVSGKTTTPATHSHLSLKPLTSSPTTCLNTFAQLRASQFVQSATPPQQLRWIVAHDMPYLGDIKRLKGAELAKREAQWLQKHDQATVGIMGLFPATLGEPVRLTATQSKDHHLFKDTHGILVNWELHPVDVALLQGQQSQELIPRQTPRKLYVQIP